MVNFDLNMEHFNGTLDVEHFMGFLAHINESEDVTKDQAIEMIIDNVSSHVNPYQVDKKNIITKVIEKFLIDLANRKGVNINGEVDKDITKSIVLDKLDSDQLDNLALYFICQMLKSSQLNMEVNHGVPIDDTSKLALVLANMM